MKAGTEMSQAFSHPRLYIPHGSDESKFILYFFSGGNCTLYPTWFRWKQQQEIQNYLFYPLYIPHGSDERGETFP